MNPKKPAQSHSKVVVKRPNTWASFEEKLSVKSGRPEGDWKTKTEISAILGVGSTSAKRKIDEQIKKGAMEKTTRLYNRNITAFYRPLPSK
jgi:hypothetical protein